MKYLTPKEKLELLNTTPRENLHEIEDAVLEGDVVDAMRIAVRFNIRKWIRMRMNEAGVSQNDLARRIGKPQPHICNFLNGKIPLPLGAIEEIIWILMPDNCGKEDYE